MPLSSSLSERRSGGWGNAAQTAAMPTSILMVVLEATDVDLYGPWSSKAAAGPVSAGRVSAAERTRSRLS